MKFLEKYGAVMLFFVPMMGIPLGIILTFTFPYGMYVFMVIVVAIVFMMLGFGLSKMVSSTGGVRNAPPRSQDADDAVKNLTHEYRHRNAQDGKY
jgi:hypothetical protein